MKLYEFRETKGIDSFVRAERPQPRPAHGQVLVRVKAASVNYRDLLVAKGRYGRSVRLPLVPFSDSVGEVVEVGEGVSRFKPGDCVAAIFMQAWLGGGLTAAKAKSALGAAIDGVLAKYVVLHEDGLVRVPEHLSYEEAATLPCAAVTAWHALITEGGLKAGDTVLVMGTGGVSIFALQFARMAGARVIATSSSDKRLERLKQLGVGSREMFEAMNRAIAANQLHPVVDRVFPFDQAREALRYLESGAHFGKVVVSVV
jgi:NADPH:quinone reductase-like Zn-dependent oxidoreductase